MAAEKGILNVTVALLAERASVRRLVADVSGAMVEHDGSWSAERIAEAIEDLGFEAKPLAEMTTEGVISVAIYGMTCASCVPTRTRYADGQMHRIGRARAVRDAGHPRGRGDAAAGGRGAGDVRSVGHRAA